MNNQAQQLLAWQERLGARTLLDNAHDIANGVVDPKTANAEACWQVMWRVPLYANTFVSNGDGMIERLAPFMDGAWRTWGKSDGPYHIEHLGGANKTENFAVGGHEAVQIALCRVARHRLFAIQGAAKGLREITAEHGDTAPFASFPETSLDQLVPRLIELFGRGWGPTTVLHMLTDFGLAVKPDLHLMRTIKSLGLVPNLKTSGVPNLSEALSINAAVRKLAADIYGPDFAPRDLRLLDVLLMEASRQRLISQSIREAA